MARLNIERQKELEPERIKHAIKKLNELGYMTIESDNTKIKFWHKGEPCLFYPYSGWHTGKTIKDGRGLNNLLNQLKVNL